MRTKICRVCGDHANGFNFNVITCESCKAFFRRNAHKRERFQCSFDGDCLIDVRTRRFCQKCRIEKCFQVDMKQEWILTDEQKKMKRAKILENRMRKAVMNQVICGESSKMTSNYANLSHPEILSATIYQPPQESVLHSQGIFTSEPIHESTSNTYTIMNKSQVVEVDGSHNSSYSEDPQTSQELTTFCSEEAGPNQSTPGQVFNEFNQLQRFRSIKVHQRILETNFTSIFLRNQNLTLGSPLNELETMKMTELIDAFKQIDEPLITQQIDDYFNLTDLARLTEVAIKRMIRWCKKIQSFRNLCQDDQIALLKGGSLEMLLIKSSVYFNTDAEAWEDYHTNLALGIKIFQKAQGDLYQVHLNFMKNFDARLRKDECVNLLLTAIVLFSSERPNLRHSNTVRLEQSSYEYLLRRYLESRSSGDFCQATSDYFHLMHVLEYLRELNGQLTKLYQTIGPEGIGPLLIELLQFP